jgi:PadR family transcriptional regulator PadR
MQFSKEILKGAAELIVLQALQHHGEAYGYQLLQSIRVDSHEIFEFQEGTLYPLLYRLERRSWIRSVQKSAPSGKIRRYYSLTNKGRRVLKDRKAEYAVFLRGMKNVLEAQR